MRACCNARNELERAHFFLIPVSKSSNGIRPSGCQVSINNDSTSPDASAMLDVKSTTKGVLLPRMTQAEIGAISSPANGLVVFCTTDNKFYIYITSAYAWKEILYGSGTITPACGSSITITHVAGNVAPVDKTVTYGTVTNIPGTTTKCWITQNLGADQQATAVNDATEASAGWYWQFNRQQGYKHTGSTLTPAWTITSINENSDWLIANDPCALLLGSGWRLPTSTEWTNVDASGGWTNWNGPWNSALKMHAAGYLNSTNGALYVIGSSGNYGSSSQYDNSYGWYLTLGSGYCYMNYSTKANGFSSRCLRD